MVGQQVLVLFIGVRIPSPELYKISVLKYQPLAETK